jgi:flagellar biosynthesis/type III secretory pathway protein FliH
MEDTVKRFAGRAVLALGLLWGACFALSSSAYAQYGYGYDYDGGSGRQAHQYGYQNGYEDGYRKGQHEGREHDPGDINIRALREATHGYRRWMGPLEAFRDGYRDGYRRGFREGYNVTAYGWRDRRYDEYGY